MDLVSLDPTGEFALLLMVGGRSWDGTEAGLQELQDKANAYLQYALDGQMIDDHAQAKGRRLMIVLSCFEEPDPLTGCHCHDGGKIGYMWCQENATGPCALGAPCAVAVLTPPEFKPVTLAANRVCQTVPLPAQSAEGMRENP